MFVQRGHLFTWKNDGPRNVEIVDYHQVTA
jgi:hypothetical protein